MSLYHVLFFFFFAELGRLEVRYSRGMHFLCLISLLNMTLKRRSMPLSPENELSLGELAAVVRHNHAAIVRNESRQRPLTSKGIDICPCKS